MLANNLPDELNAYDPEIARLKEVVAQRRSKERQARIQESNGNIVPLKPGQQDMIQCLDYALLALKSGLCVMPAIEDGTKQPFGNSVTDRRWTHFQKELPTEAKIREWYVKAGLTNIGYVCGKVSGNLEALDFDERAIYDVWRQHVVASGLADLLERMEMGYMEYSPNGVHLLYRCSDIGGSTKLATRPKRDEEKKSVGDKTKTLIETKGEGGYIICAPSHGGVNPSGDYTLVSGSIAKIPTISPAERQELFRIATSLHIDPPELCEAERKHHKKDTQRQGGYPGDEFNAKAEWRDILEPHGWKFLFERSGVIFLRRPGKDAGISATINYQENDLLHMFTSSTEFEPQKSYSKFAAYTILNHKSDYKAATKQLASEGYGKDIPLDGFDGKNSRDWPDPLPLPDGLPQVKQLTPELLPEGFRPWLCDIAERMAIPLDYPTVAAITAASSVIGRGCGIRPKQKDDWLVAPNLWGAIVGPPSFLKTPASTEAMKPLDRLEVEAKKQFESKNADFKIAEMIAKAKRDALEKQIRDAATKGCDYSADMARSALSESEVVVPTRKRFYTADATPEKVIELLNQNPRGLMIKRDELIGWLSNLDKEGRKGSRALFLEGWNGTGRYSYDTVSRGTVDIEALTITVYGAITPGPLADYVYSASKGGSGDDGLLQRFQLLVWPDAPKTWQNIDRWPDTKHKNLAHEIFKQLTGEIPGVTADEEEGIPYLRFSQAGQVVFDEWRFKLENRLRGDHNLPAALESHLGKYRSLMPSLALIFHLIDVVSGICESVPVSENAALMAVGWCEYLESHAVRIYRGTLSPDMQSAQELIKHIQRGAIKDGDSIKEVYRHGWAKLTTPEEVKAGLRILSDYDWVVIERADTGGRPSDVIRLNPKLL